MAVLEQAVEIDAPVSAVFAFHEREDALPLLTPPFPPVRVVSKSGGIEPGGRVELQVGPFRWTALHTEYEKDRLFVDEQIRGPFARWVHRHQFEPIDGGRSRLTDRVEYLLPGGKAVTALFGWAVRLGLRRMFAFRHAATSASASQRPSAARHPT